jgi:hypothetical protein
MSTEKTDAKEEAKAKALKEALVKGKGKKAKGKAETNPGHTIDNVTMKLLEQPITTAELVKKLAKEFPSHDVEVLKKTTKRRLTGYLAKKRGIKIVKNDAGEYHIVKSNKAA